MAPRILMTFFLCLAFAVPASAATTAELLRTLKSVGAEGKGNAEAQRALKELSASGTDALLPVLNAFEGAGPLAANWLRSAFESIADSAEELPATELSEFITQTKHDPRARSLAFEWLNNSDRAAAEKLIPSFLQDPSADLRRVAVARLLESAKNIDADAKPDAAKAIYQKALLGAVDDDQVKEIVPPLKKLGVEVDLQKHFGFLTSWHVIGPFDNRGGKGFATVYPPENNLDLKATYTTEFDDGFDKGTVKWEPLQTDDKYGLVNFAKQVKNYKGSCIYATTKFESSREREVEFRLGTPNAWKLWLNGKQLFAREEYHRGTRMDQYVVRGKLKAGGNEILIKVCQNEQTDDWAQRYQFQLRVCDGAGSAILSAQK